MKKIMFAFIVFLSALNLGAQDGAISVKVTGTGNPLIFLPGFACTGEEWAETVDKLEGKFECHVITYAGFGDVAPVDTPWMETEEDAIITYIEKKKLKNVVIIGHSIGATFGISLCSKYKNVFSKLVVVDELPCIGKVMFPDFSPAMVSFDNPYNQQLLNMDNGAFSGMVTQMAGGLCLQKDKQTLIAGWMVKADRKTYVYGYTELLKTDLRDKLSAIQVPVLILAATFYPGKEQIEKNYNEQYRDLPNKTLILVDNAAHFIMYDQPEKFVNELIRFLGSNTAENQTLTSPYSL